MRRARYWISYRLDLLYCRRGWEWALWLSCWIQPECIVPGRHKSLKVQP